MTGKDEMVGEMGKGFGQSGEPLQTEAAISVDDIEVLSPEASGGLLETLRIKLGELEKQNGELRSKLQESAFIKTHYYDQAPVGYCTLTEEGLILEVNLTAAVMLGLPAQYPNPQPISAFIFPDDRDVFYRQHKLLFRSGQTQACDLRMQDTDGNKFWARIEGSIVQNCDGAPLGRVVLSDISERKRLEAAQREAEARFRVLSDDIPGCICTFLPDSTIASCNQAMADLTGMRAEEMIGLKFFDLLDPKDYKFVINSIASLSPENPSETHEQVHKTLDGNKRFIEWRNRAFFNEQGKAYRYLGVGIDITDRKKAEEELRASEARFRILLDSLPAISVQGYAPDGTTQYWNQASERLYGYRAEEAIGRNLLELIIPPEMQEGVKQAIRQMAETGQPIPSAELSLMRADGSRVAVFSSHAIVHRQGHPFELFCMDIDLTDLKKVQEALRKSEESFREIFNSTTEAIFIDDAETGQMIDVNDTMLRIYGYDHKEEVLAGNIGDLSANEAPYTDKRAQEMIRKAIQEGPQVFEWLAKKKDGTKFWIEISLCKSQIGGKGRILAVARDISKRKRTEEALLLYTEKVRRSETELKKAQAIAHVGNWIWDIKNNHIEWSDEMYRIFGIDPNNVTGRLGDAISKVVHPEDLHIVQTSNALAFAKHKPVEYRIILPDQSIRYILAETGEVILDEEGNPAFLTGTAQDITMHKDAENALRKSEQRYHLIDEASQDLIYSYDCQGRFTHANTNLCKLLGRSLEQILGKTHAELGFPPEVCAEWTKLHEQVFRTNAMLISETTTPILNGPPQYFEVVLNPIHDENGSIIGIAGTTRDINVRKKAEAKINEQLEELRRWQKITMGREARILELKQEVNRLLAEAGKPARYAGSPETRTE